MRLKGGKLLYGKVFVLGNDDSYQLTDEEFKIAIEKGIVIKINDGGSFTYTHDVCFNIIGNDYLKETITDGDGDTYRLTLGFNNKRIALFSD